MFCHKTILTSCVYLVTFSFLALGNSKESHAFQAPCSISFGSNTSCVNVTNNIIKSVWNKSIEAFRYQLKLISVSKCNVPLNRIDPSHPMTVKNTIKRISREVSLLDMEVRNMKKIGPLFLSCRSYIVKQNSVKDLIYKVDRASCAHSFMMRMRILLKLDKMMTETCYTIPGTFKMEDINVDNFSGVLQRTITTAGIYSYELELSHSQGTVECFAFNCQVIERKQINT